MDQIRRMSAFYVNIDKPNALTNFNKKTQSVVAH